MAGITTAMATSFKVESWGAAHCFQATATPTGTNTSGQFTFTSMSSIAGLSVGMAISGTNIPAASVIASIDSATQITISKATTGGPNTGITLTCVGDVYKIALFVAAPAGTFDATTTNYAGMGSDEVATATGYTRPGIALTNVTPTIPSGTTAITNFSPNPSWTSSTFSTLGCMIYNTGARLGQTGTYANVVQGRTVSVHNFGSQSVTSGTFTVVMPTADATNAILRFA